MNPRALVMTTLMKCLLVMGLCVGLPCCSPQGELSDEELAQAEADIRGSAEFATELETMIRVLGLNAADAQRLGQAHAARYEALDQFLSGEDGQRLMALEAKLRGAVAAKDLGAVKGIIAEARPLREAFRQRIATEDAALLGVLTPDQATHWQGHEVASRLLQSMDSLDLTAEQMGAISEAGPAAFFRAQEAGELNPKAAAFLALEAWAESDVLSSVQRDAYQGIKAQKGLRSL